MQNFAPDVDSSGPILYRPQTPGMPTSDCDESTLIYWERTMHEIEEAMNQIFGSMVRRREPYCVPTTMEYIPHYTIVSMCEIHV